MSIIEDSPSSVETSATPVHGTNTQANVTYHMGAAALESINLTRHYVTRAVQDVINPAITTFLETRITNPRITAVVATPVLLGSLLVLAIFTISTLVLTIWTILTITSSITFVIIGGIISLFSKLLVVVLATIKFAAIATGLLVGVNAIPQFIINQSGVGTVFTQTVKQTERKPVVGHLINFGKKLGLGVMAVWERLLILRAALHDSYVAFKSATEDPHNARVESLHKDRSEPSSDFTAKTTGHEESSKNIHQTQSTKIFDPQSTEGLKRRAPYPGSEDFAVDVDEPLKYKEIYIASKSDVDSSLQF